MSAFTLESFAPVVNEEDDVYPGLIFLKDEMLVIGTCWSLVAIGTDKLSQFSERGTPQCLKQCDNFMENACGASHSTWRAKRQASDWFCRNSISIYSLALG